MREALPDVSRSRARSTSQPTHIETIRSLHSKEPRMGSNDHVRSMIARVDRTSIRRIRGEDGSTGSEARPVTRTIQQSADVHRPPTTCCMLDAGFLFPHDDGVRDPAQQQRRGRQGRLHRRARLRPLDQPVRDRAERSAAIELACDILTRERRASSSRLELTTRCVGVCRSGCGGRRGVHLIGASRSRQGSPMSTARCAGRARRRQDTSSPASTGRDQPPLPAPTMASGTRSAGRCSRRACE